jgi:hypothetical protein
MGKTMIQGHPMIVPSLRRGGLGWGGLVVTFFVKYAIMAWGLYS